MNQRHLAVGALFELELHLALVERENGIDIGVKSAKKRDALSGEDLKAEDHVGRSHGDAIVPARCGVEFKDDPRAILRHLHLRGELAVFRERLVLGLSAEPIVEHQRAVGGHPLEGEGIEVVVRADGGEADFASFGGVGIDVVEVGKIRPVLGVAVEREGVGAENGAVRSMGHRGEDKAEN